MGGYFRSSPLQITQNEEKYILKQHAKSHNRRVNKTSLTQKRLSMGRIAIANK